MKINYILRFKLIVLQSFTSLFLYSQPYPFDCQPTYHIGSSVYTCNGLAVEAHFPSCEFSVYDKAYLRSSLLAEYASRGITNNDILDDASTQYNCHAYAWHLSQGHTNKVWINQYDVNKNPNLNKYWHPYNSCYVFTTESEAEKIFYMSTQYLTYFFFPFLSINHL
jgi:hypothetical protein